MRAGYYAGGCHASGSPMMRLPGSVQNREHTARTIWGGLRRPCRQVAFGGSPYGKPAQNAVVCLEGRNFPRTVLGQVVFVFSCVLRYSCSLVWFCSRVRPACPQFTKLAAQLQSCGVSSPAILTAASCRLAAQSPHCGSSVLRCFLPLRWASGRLLP